MIMKKYLITGGTGFIGSALVKRLLNLGHQVSVLDNNIRGRSHRLDLSFRNLNMIEGDITHFSDVYNACKNIDSIIHLAYLNGTAFFYSKPELVLKIAVKGIAHILDAAIQNGIKEFVLASSSEVYQMPSKIPTDETVPLIVPDPLNPRYSYGGGKIISELMALHYGRKEMNRILIFRPHNVYGPDMGWEHVIPEFMTRLKTLIDKHPHVSTVIPFHIQGSGEESRSFIYIDDFIDGLLTILEKGEHLNIYHIGTMEEITIADLVRTIAQDVKRKIEVLPSERRAGSTFRRCPDISKIKKLGFFPKISLKSGIKRTREWYFQHADENPWIKQIGGLYGEQQSR